MLSSLLLREVHHYEGITRDSGCLCPTSDELNATLINVRRAQGVLPSEGVKHGRHADTYANMCGETRRIFAYLTGTLMATLDAELMSRAALAKQAGISSTTLRNWSELADQPLEVVRTVAGARLYSWSALLRFCDRHPDLHGVAAVRARQRNVAETPGDPNVRIALAEMKGALDANLAAIARATRLATETAASHAETVAALQRTIRAYEL
ncbi:MAG: hypothetical protein JO246_01120, partial [Frankiaceae bacterium]|nr:hypothetical protein [Frankiaceae bacterium]